MTVSPLAGTYYGQRDKVTELNSLIHITRSNWFWLWFWFWFCVELLTLLCWQSIQKTLGCLWRRTPLLHTSSRSPLRRSPGPHSTFSGLTGSVREMVSSPSQENSSPGNRTSPTRCFNVDNIAAWSRKRGRKWRWHTPETKLAATEGRRKQDVVSTLVPLISGSTVLPQDE